MIVLHVRTVHSLDVLYIQYRTRYEDSVVTVRRYGVLTAPPHDTTVSMELHTVPKGM